VVQELEGMAAATEFDSDKAKTRTELAQKALAWLQDKV
jgi:hypothetical protein